MNSDAQADMITIRVYAKKKKKRKKEKKDTLSMEQLSSLSFT